jgi:hypothetical protein
VAETVVINIEANTSGLQSTIDLLVKLGQVEKATAEEFKKVNEANMASIAKASQTTVKEFEKVNTAVKNIKTDNTLAKSLDVTKEAAQAGNAIKSLKTQLKEAVTEAQDLAEKFGDLDPRTLAAAKRAAELRDKIGDVNAQINALTPEGKFKAIQNLGGAIAGVFQVATGALQAFGVESEQASKLAQQFQGALNIFAGLSQLTQLKDAYTAVQGALGLSTAAKVADTTATEGQIVATEGATVAQTGLNAAILANPYVAAAAALAAVVGALYLFSDSADEAEKAQQRLNTAIDIANKLYEQDVKIQDRISRERLNDIQNRIELAQIEGKSAKEIGELKKEEQRITLQGLQADYKAREENIRLNEEAADKLLKLNTDEAQSKRNSLLDQTDALKEANKENLSQQRMLASDFKVLEAQTTKDIKDEQDKRVKDAKEARDKINELSLTANLEAIRKKYADERILAYQTYKDKEALELALTDITDKELSAQLELYKKGSKEYQEIVLKRAELARNNPVEQIVKFKTEDNQPTEADQPQPITVPVNYEVSTAGREGEIKAREQLEASLKELQTVTIDLFSEFIFNSITQGFEDQINNINTLKEAQLEAIDEEETALQNSYDNRRIGKRELEAEQQRLALQRIAAEKKAENELNAIRKKQDAAKKAQAIFDIAISTAKAVMAITGDITVPVLAKPGLIAAAIALGSIQAAAVIAQPLPKYKKGTLSVGGVGSEDTELALLQPGEAVIPTDTNRRYKTAISAIYHNKIKPDDINNWVNLRLRGDMSQKESGPLTAKLDTSDIYSLSRMMKKNDGVYVKNIGELATIIASLNNPRR